MTQESLAKAVHLTRASISNIERGRQQVYLHTLYALSEALGVTVDKLLPSPTAVAGGRLEAKLAMENVDSETQRRLLRVLQG